MRPITRNQKIFWEKKGKSNETKIHADPRRKEMALSSAAPWHQHSDTEMDPTDKWAQSWICCKAKKASSIILVHERHPRDNIFISFYLEQKTPTA